MRAQHEIQFDDAHLLIKVMNLKYISIGRIYTEYLKNVHVHGRVNIRCV